MTPLHRHRPAARAARAVRAASACWPLVPVLAAALAGCASPPATTARTPSGTTSGTSTGPAAATAAAAPAPTATAAAAASASPRRSCEQLQGLAVPASAIGAPTGGATVTSAQVVAAGGSGARAHPAFCEVMGRITPVDLTAPNILFQLALPVGWNDKLVMFGGGGFNGTIPSVKNNVPAGPADQPTPLGRGYATLASDSGHQANALGSRDGLFGLHDEALRNYGGDALKKTRDAALAVLRAHYGRAPVKAYFAGGSNGGREALTIIQRWPADWDGAIAWYPAWNDVGALLGGHHLGRALARPGAYPNPAKRLALYDAAMEACDALDGVADGLISHQALCNSRFDPATATLRGQPLRCPGGADTGDTCLSDAQIGAARTIHAPLNFGVPMLNGDTSYPGYNLWGADVGISAWNKPTQGYVNFVNYGSAAPGRPMPFNAPFMAVLTDQWLRYFVARDPGFDAQGFDPEQPGRWATRLREVSALLDARTDIAAFQARGGKLLLAHGLGDVVVSSRATQQYHARLQAQFGQAMLDGFVRYYEVPGYGHAAGSVFNAAWDSLTALDEWSTQGRAPTAQVVTDTTGVPGRTRPLCDYPQWPRYRGTGDVNAAASFVCSR